MKSPKPKKPAVFLDRDGVLNHDSGYVFAIKDLIVLPGVAAGLKRLADSGFELIVITNQSGVARGMFGLAQVDAFHRALTEKIAAKGGPRLTHFYVCPHHPDGNTPPFNIVCSCRKPEPGLLEEAFHTLALDRGRSFFVGDKPSDVHCGQKAHVRTVQIAGERYEREESADLVTDSFEGAVEFILKSVAAM